MSDRAKARMVVAEAEEIARQAAEPEPEPMRCVVCGQVPTVMVFTSAGGPWCSFCNPNALVWDERTQTFVPPGATP